MGRWRRRLWVEPRVRYALFATLFLVALQLLSNAWVKRNLEAALSQSGSVLGAITHQGVWLWPWSQVHVFDLQWHLPNGAHFTIERAELHAAHLPALIQQLQQLGRGRLPPKLDLHLYRARLKLRDLPQWLSYDPYLPASMLQGCGAVVRINAEALRAMGYADPHFDARIGVDLGTEGRSWTLTIQVHAAEMSRLDLQLKLAIDRVSQQRLDLTLGNPLPLGRIFARQLDVRIEDLGFSRRKLDYCLRLAGQTPETYLANAAQRLQRALSTVGIEIGSGWLHAWQMMLSAPSRALELRLAPEMALNLKRLSELDPALLGRYLQPQLSVSGVDIEQSLSLSVASALWPQPEPEVEPEPDATQVAISVPFPERERPAAVSLPAFRPLPVRNLPSHVGATVRLQTLQRNNYVGTVEGSDGDQVLLEVRLRGGRASFALPLSSISEAEILR